MRSVTARIDSHIRLPLQQLPDELRLDLQQQFSRPNPERLKAESIGRAANWMPAMVRMWKQEGGDLLIPRGAISLLRSRAKVHGVALLWQSAVTKRAETQIPFDDLPIRLREYQRQGVQALLDGVQGYIVAPCGAGKTVMGASALVASGEPGLILAHTHDLLEQWLGLLRSWEYRVRVISGGKLRGLATPLRMRNGEPEYAVATVQTLSNAGEKANEFLASCGAVLLDEAHHAPASTFSSVLQQIPARYRWGVTATPDREDGWGFALPMVIGRELWRIGMRDLVDQGFLMQPTLLRMQSGVSIDLRKCTTKNGQISAAKAVNQLCSSDQRNSVLVAVAQQLAEAGRVVLMLVPRVNQAHRLATTLTRKGILAMAVTSKVGKGLRQQRLRQVRSGQVQVLVATQLADEGLDVPGLDALIVASAGRSAARSIQRIGRVMRIAEGKRKPIVIDVVDPTPFGGQAQARARAYHEHLGIMAPPAISQAETSQYLSRCG